MAKKGSRAAKTTNKPASKDPAPAAAKLPAAKALVAPKPDVRRWIYGVADIVFTIGYLWVFTSLLHNRFGWARAILYLLPFCTLVMAIGTLVSGRGGWIATVAGSAGMLLWTIGFIILLLVTASYLAGVYGAFGKAASLGVLGSTAFVVQFGATLPALQLKWAMTRGGRRAFGLPPLWTRVAG